MDGRWSAEVIAALGASIAAGFGSLGAFVVALRRAYPGHARALRRETRELWARVEQLEQWGSRAGLVVPAWPERSRRRHRREEAR